VALRRIDTLAGISRFASSTPLMAFFGPVPGEHSSGGRRRHGAIRRCLVAPCL
jgi:transposase